MIKLHRYLTISPEFHREKEFNAINRTRKTMMPHAPDPISEQGYFITKEDLRKRDKIFYEFGKESKDYERASAEVFEEMAIDFAGQELRKAIDKDIVEELSKKDK